jgi:hypothetical protein
VEAPVISLQQLPPHYLKGELSGPPASATFEIPVALATVLEMEFFGLGTLAASAMPRLLRMTAVSLGCWLAQTSLQTLTAHNVAEEAFRRYKSI